MAKTIIVVRTSGSLFPVEWTVIQEDNSWFTLYPQGRENNPEIYLHACELAASGTRVAFVVCAPTPAMEARITALASASTNAWTLVELKADNSILATKLKQVWRDQVSGTIEFNQSMAGHTYPNNLLNND